MVIGASLAAPPLPELMRPTFLPRLASLALAALAVGCLSPTLPLPPPDAPETIRSVGTDRWGIGGTCVEGAEVVVLDQVTGRGSVYVDLERTGRYYVEIDAKTCDLATVAQTAHGQSSATTSFTVAPVEPGLPPSSTCSP
jgi:hypothetical protein